MLKHASPSLSSMDDSAPYLPSLGRVDSEERVSFEDHNSSRAFTKAPGFFIRSTKRGSKARASNFGKKHAIKRRKPESSEWTVDKGSPRPTFQRLESKLKRVQEHWKRKAWTKTSLGKKEDLESKECLNSFNLDYETPDHLATPSRSITSESPSSPSETKAAAHVKKQTNGDLEASDILASSGFFEVGGDFFSDSESEYKRRASISRDQTQSQTSIVSDHESYPMATIESLEESLSELPSGLHHVDVHNQMRHRTMSGRGAEILMAGKDDDGITVLVRYDNSDALHFRKLNSVRLASQHI